VCKPFAWFGTPERFDDPGYVTPDVGRALSRVTGAHDPHGIRVSRVNTVTTTRADRHGAACRAHGSEHMTTADSQRAA
jgi:hypothetical protein